MTAPKDTRVIDSDTIVDQVERDLSNSRLEYYKLSSDGMASYTFRVLELGSGTATNRTMDVNTTHVYTTDRGYIYNSSGIFTPGGRQQVVIQTFPGPPGFEGRPPPSPPVE